MKETAKITNYPATLNSNFHPCLVFGKAQDEAVWSTNRNWNAIGWKIIGEKDTTLEMIAVFYNNKNADARAFFRLDTETGKVSNFLFENIVSFYMNDAFNAGTAKEHSKKSNDAFKYVVRLVHYFNRVNSVEEEKTKTEKTATRERRMVAEHFATKVQSPKTSTYNPNKEKVVYAKKDVPHKKQKNFTKTSWLRAGHYRTYKNGKTIYVKPTEVNRHA